MHNAPPRLTRLDRILSLSQPAVAARAADTDPQQVHLASVPLERIQALTAELRDRLNVEPDEVDAVTMRLLLNDYKVAVGHLRAVANNVEVRLRAAGQTIHDTRKTVRREEEMAAKRAAHAERDE